jgi:outer membrane immunogenic protein
MNRLALAAVSLSALVAAPAFAADMPLKAPPPAVAPAPLWTGFYLGANVGYSWGNSSTTYTGTGTGFVPFTTSRAMDGVLGGGQIGYNWQFNTNWVLGVEADIQGTGQSGTTSFPGVTTTLGVPGVAVTTIASTGSLKQSLPWFGTLRGRFGVNPTPTSLLYVTGGLAFGEIDSTASFTTTVSTPGGTASASASSSSNVTRAGWTVGGGIEGVITGAWTAKLEYLYMDFGTFNNAFVGTPVGAYTTLAANSHVTDNIVRVGVDYHFNWGGPIATRY